MRKAGVLVPAWCVMIGLSANADELLERLAADAAAFLSCLDEEQKALAALPFNSDERLNWHYVPKERAGVSFKRLRPEQTEKALQLLRTALSHEGFEKIETIRRLEDVLWELQGGRGTVRDRELYYVAVFGPPSTNTDWGLRYEGHHISLNWTVVGGRIVSSLPQFLGANPAEVQAGPLQGTRALAKEEDLARHLLRSLDDAQRKTAVLHPKAPPEILTGAQREAAIQEDLGLAYAAMTPEQQGVLISLIEVYAGTMPRPLAEARLQKIRAAGLDSIKFAWMGGLEKGEGHYYRVQGPTFLIEYDNTQNNANHIHTVWRDFQGDFGRDVLKEHYQAHARPGDAHGHDH